MSGILGPPFVEVRFDQEQSHASPFRLPEVSPALLPRRAPAILQSCGASLIRRRLPLLARTASFAALKREPFQAVTVPLTAGEAGP
jgi:hypothetical protein